MPNKPPNHRPAHSQGQGPRRRHDDEARREAHRFYCSARWRKFRAWFLAQPENALCAHCKREPATEVNHLREVRDCPDLALDPSNVEGLCLSCHSRHTAKTTGFGRCNPDPRAEPDEPKG